MAKLPIEDKNTGDFYTAEEFNKVKNGFISDRIDMGDPEVEGSMRICMNASGDELCVEQLIDSEWRVVQMRADIIAQTGSIAFEDSSVLSTNTDSLEVQDCVRGDIHELVTSKYSDSGSEVPYYSKKAPIESFDVQLLDDEQQATFAIKFPTLNDVHFKTIVVKPMAAGNGVFTMRDTDENGCVLNTETRVTFTAAQIGTEVEIPLKNRIKLYTGQVIWVAYTGAPLAGHSFSSDPTWGSQFVPFVKTRSQRFTDEPIATEAFVEGKELSAADVKTLYESNLDTNAFTDDEQTKLENISENHVGDSWVSGLDVIEADPKDQTVDYGAGTYLINGLTKSIATAGNYDLTTHYSGMVDDQHAIVLLYVDNDETMKSVMGEIGEKYENVFAPLLPENSVCVAAIEIKVDKNDNPKDIGNKQITDCRNSININTDEFIKISADDETTGHLRDKISDNGNVKFSIENPGLSETMKAEVDIAADSAVSANTAKVSFPEAPSDGKQYARKDSGWEEVTGGGALPTMTHTTDANIDNLDVSSLAPAGILFTDMAGNRELRSLAGGVDGQIVTLANVADSTIKLKHDSGAGQKLMIEGGADKTFGDYGGCTLVYNSAKGYWFVVGIII